jgi:oxygen-independent coproporphyrinogen-3 oxidase
MSVRDLLSTPGSTSKVAIAREDVPSYWAEYPDRDVEYVRWYPCVVRHLTERQVWAPRQLAFYVHVPFCNQLCNSCPYNKELTKRGLTRGYLDALKKEIDMYASRPYVRDSLFVTGYIGGGTPTALSTEQLQELLRHLKSRIHLAPDAHLTIESTPLEITGDKSQMLRDEGVQRISMGIQSFDDVLLRRINRSHTRDMIYQKLTMLRADGWQEIGLDFMYGLPGQTLESWQRTIEELLKLSVASVSFYVFLLLPESELFRLVREGREPPPADQSVVDAMHDYSVQTLLGNGYVAVSNCDFGNDNQIGHDDWERAGVQVYSLGTRNYRGVMVPTFPRTRYLTHLWYECGELLSVGPGAYGYVRDHIYLNEPDINTYIAKVQNGTMPQVLGTYVSPREKMARNMALGIKLLRMSRQSFVDRFGIDMTVPFGPAIERLIEQGLVTLSDEHIQVTYPKGWLYQDNISKAFYTAANHRLPQPSPNNSRILQYLRPDMSHRRGQKGTSALPILTR